MAIGLRYQALANKQIDVVNGYATNEMIISTQVETPEGRRESVAASTMWRRSCARMRWTRIRRSPKC